MPSNLLVFLPLLAGYIFLHVSYRFRYRAKTLEGHRLVYETAIAGFVIFAVARFLVLGADALDWIDPYWSTWRSMKSDVPLLGTSLASLGLAALFGFISNTYVAWRVGGQQHPRPSWTIRFELAKLTALRSALASSKNELKDLLSRSAEEGDLVLLSMRDRKVYVGWVVDSPTPDRNETDLAILPIYSGHRRTDDLRVVLDTPYPIDRYEGDLDPEDFIVALRVGEILSARQFDEEVFRNLFGGVVGGVESRTP